MLLTTSWIERGGATDFEADLKGYYVSDGYICIDTMEGLLPEESYYLDISLLIPREFVTIIS